MQKIVLSLIAAFLLQGAALFSQTSDDKLSNRVNVLFGLNQPLLNGFNIEVNLFYKRFAFDYSHGVSLNLGNETLSGDYAEQGLAIHIPYTTGFGIGYRFNDWLNLRVEPKWHRFEVYYGGDAQVEDNLIGAYNTFSLGLGGYANVRPFKHARSFVKGFMISPSVRWWPKLNSSLENDAFSYENRRTGQSETHEALEVGIADTPLIVNISVGYSIAF